MKNNFFKYWAPLYMYAGLIFYLSSLTKVLPEVDIPSFDKVLHIVEYAIFSILALRAFRNSKREFVLKNLKLVAITISILYGMSDEFHQSFVPGRQCSIWDMLFDGIGSTIGVIFYGKYCSI
ncbi:MAG: VanZ family protein [Candidatus Omnitrophota bacterium]